MNKNLPLVTIITITYNIIKTGRDKFINQCFESIHNQTYPNIEHIVIDGASTDGTLNIIKKYAEQKKLKYFSEPDNGIYDAMNKGILKAKGQYIAFMNSDDFYNRNDAVEQAVKVLEEQNADFCGGNTFFLDEANPLNSHYRFANLNQAFTLMPFCHQTMFCRRSVLIAEKMFDTSFKSAGDYDLILRLYLKRYKGAVVPLTYVTFRIGGESFVNYKTSHNECLHIMDKYFGDKHQMNEDEHQNWIYHHELPTKLEELTQQYLIDKTAYNIPKLTVITVCFNIIKAGRMESFRNCVKSVHNQSYPNIEHLVVDGASTDGTADILKEYADKGWIKYVSEPDNGIYDAMRKGVAYSSGEYCYFLNTDDYFYDNDVVKDMMKAFEEYNVDACFGDLFPYLLDENAQYVKVFEINKPASFADIVDKQSLLKRSIHHQTIFYNKRIFYNSSFFDERVTDGSDWLLHCQAFIKNNYTFKHIERTVTCFNMGGVSTKMDNNPIDEYLRIQKYLYETFEQYIEKPVEAILKKNQIKKKKIKVGPLTLLRIKEKAGSKNIYLFNFLKILKIKKKQNRKKIYLFGFVLLFSKKNYKKIINSYQKLLYDQQTHFNSLIAEKDRILGNMSELINTKLKEMSSRLADMLVPQENPQEYLKSFSQAGEDKVIDFIFFYFTDIDRSHVRYLDIGANYPIDNNNTYFYYIRDGHGVLVEPNKELCKLAETKRPRDVIINAGIKFNEQDSSEYYAFDENGLNTFDKSRVEHITSMGHKLTASYPVTLISVNDILNQYFSDGIDLVSIDAEGVDIAILKSLDFERFRPILFCVEANKDILSKASQKTEVVKLLESKNYLLMADTSINYIFLAREALVLDKYC